MLPANYELSGPDVQEFHVSKGSTVWSNLPRYASACAKWVSPPRSCSSTVAAKTRKLTVYQQWQLYHSHNLWSNVPKVTVMLSSVLVDNHHASWILSVPFTWLRHRNQWECSGFESNSSSAYVTVRPFALRFYTWCGVCQPVGRGALCLDSDSLRI